MNNSAENGLNNKVATSTDGVQHTGVEQTGETRSAQGIFLSIYTR